MRKREECSFNLEEAKAYAYKILAIRDRTIKNLKEKLKGKGFPGSTILKAIDFLRSRGFLSDEHFAYKYARLRVALKPRGPYLLDHELSNQGVSEPLRRRVISEVYGDNKEKALALEALKRKFKSMPLKKSDRERACRILLRLGFGRHTILSVLR